MSEFDYNPVVHYVTIRVHQEGQGSPVIVFLKWENMTYEVRMKWDWYFKYRAALEQVKRPRSTVIVHWGNQPAVGKPLIQQLEQKLISSKGNITRISNKIRDYENKMNGLLIWEVDRDDIYQEALQKLARLKREQLKIT